MSALLNVLLDGYARAPELEVTGVEIDSRRVTAGDVFLAVRGIGSHGLQHVELALQRGASAVVWEPAPGIAEPEDLAVPQVAVANLSKHVGEIAARFHGAPARKLFTVGVTGTDGKTSTAYLVAQALDLLGADCGYLGTIGYGRVNALKEASHTTPDAIRLQELFADFVADGLKAVAMEVSSHALDQARISGIGFDAAILTNITRDHLDYHGTVESYAAAKKKLFTDYCRGARILNRDDPTAAAWITQNRPQDVVYGIGSGVAPEKGHWLLASDIQLHGGGLAFAIQSSFGDRVEVNSPLLGRFNVYNLLAVIAALMVGKRTGALPTTFALEDAARIASKLKTVPGRMERFIAGHGLPLVVVDYAHTPAALRQVLTALRGHCKGQLICVFGCGGDRDRGKRPLMGQAAAKLADRLIVTDDNPRSERPEDIAAEILAGITDRSPSPVVIHDRAEAIRRAVLEADPDDVVLIAGKGHETTQTIGTTVREFSDRAFVQNLLAGEDEMTTLRDSARRIGAVFVGQNTFYRRVVTDTRQVQPGDLFVALKGDRFDGHDYVAEAITKGAVGALVSRPLDVAVGQIVVADTLQGLQSLAAQWRNDFEPALPLIGITGSNGKTTTKQLVAAVCAPRGPVLATEGNLNNHIGVPLTLLRLRGDHRMAVIEMGASAPGEIAALAAIARPTIAIVTQAGDAHLEGFGSRDGVAQAKGELFQALDGGTAIINADDPYADLWAGFAGRPEPLTNRILRFGFAAHADVRAEDLRSTPDGNHFTLITPAGRAAVQLPLPGRHNIANALAAAAAGHALGLLPAVIAERLAAVDKPKGRVVIHTLPNGARLIDDSYNANPTSLAAAVALLVQERGERVLVLGDMAELGPKADELHARAGIEAKALGLNALLTLGTRSAQAAKSFGIGGKAFDSVEELIEVLRPQLKAHTTVLVKGSRSARMERVVLALLEQKTGAAH